MNDRGMKKWNGFSAVASRNELIDKNVYYKIPEHSLDEIAEFEEVLKESFYTHSKVRILYIENSKLKELEDYVERIDIIKKDVYFKTKKINFRQIVKVTK